ncbi:MULTISPECIES: hypothetical protein [unclassified Lysobacter]|uniref:hypothetical protein n=1 Tax=unclassified Lysobacter TaxID=2635362 RepID=UPI001BE5AA8D|nr:MULTISPECIES: hypothetical protein [unclassified Lysobacter]MBT2749097.1 hypothetical protein [Lysobacter sp. ISL-42]MBT2751411.1 hypothetical protein [Lysobacter sp. ISL-50]MBT2777353.1 hypothetical protein [Lysobacter sp. ISL-54]MBT2781571.1 hypothetical protein [Lysobacter sp. ISL-52]
MTTVQACCSVVFACRTASLRAPSLGQTCPRLAARVGASWDALLHKPAPNFRRAFTVFDRRRKRDAYHLTRRTRARLNIHGAARSEPAAGPGRSSARAKRFSGHVAIPHHPRPRDPAAPDAVRRRNAQSVISLV